MFRLLGFCLGLSVCMLTGACERKRRFDGSCTDDSHCLEMQKCAAGVCVRREPIFKEAAPKTLEPAVIQRTQRNPSTPTAPVVEPHPSPPGKNPGGKQPERQTVPDRKQGAFRFRLDA